VDCAEHRHGRRAGQERRVSLLPAELPPVATPQKLRCRDALKQGVQVRHGGRLVFEEERRAERVAQRPNGGHVVIGRGCGGHLVTVVDEDTSKPGDVRQPLARRIERLPCVREVDGQREVVPQLTPSAA
jgi:hypothetical protein